MLKFMTLILGLYCVAISHHSIAAETDAQLFPKLFALPYIGKSLEMAATVMKAKQQFELITPKPLLKVMKLVKKKEQERQLYVNYENSHEKESGKKINSEIRTLQNEGDQLFMSLAIPDDLKENIGEAHSVWKGRLTEYLGCNSTNTDHEKKLKYATNTIAAVMGASIGFAIAYKIITPRFATKVRSMLVKTKLSKSTLYWLVKMTPYVSTGIITVIAGLSIASISAVNFAYFSNKLLKVIN